MLDFCDLIRFFSVCMKQVNPMVNIGTNQEESVDQNKQKNTFNLMLDSLSIIGNKLLNNDPQ